MNFASMNVIHAGYLQNLRPYEVQAICWFVQPGNSPCRQIDPSMVVTRESEHDYDVLLTFTWVNRFNRRVHSQSNLRRGLLRRFWDAKLMPVYMHFDDFEAVMRCSKQAQLTMLLGCLEYVRLGHTEESYRISHGMALA